MGVATAGYCVGNLLLDDAPDAPWEDRSFAYPESLASPLQVKFRNAADVVGSAHAQAATEQHDPLGCPVIQ